MLTTHSPSPREAIRRAPEPVGLDPSLWQRILQQVRAQHPGLNRVWFDEMVPRQLTNGVIQVTVATPAQLNFCQSQCQQPFTAAAQAITGRLVAVSFHCEHLPRGGVFNEGDQPLPLNPDYVFENFVTGPCNRLPHAACVAVAEQPGTAYNPLFIHGGVGLGKTHLLQAVSQKVLERAPDSRILYLSCDSFINQFILAVENGDMHQFRHRYRHVDLLVIDDIHFLAGRERTQEEFFHTFNTLYQQHKQIILSADCPPSEIPEPEQRRITIQQILDAVTKYYNVRLGDLQSKKRHKSIAFPRQVCMYLARRHTRYSLEEIGGYFGGRDHTTVMHAVRTVGDDIKTDPEIAEQLTYLEAQLAG